MERRERKGGVIDVEGGKVNGEVRWVGTGESKGPGKLDRAYMQSN